MVELKIVLSELKGVTVRSHLNTLFNEQTSSNIEEIIFHFQSKQLKQITCKGSINIQNHVIGIQDMTYIFTPKEGKPESFILEMSSKGLTKSDKFETTIQDLFGDIKFIAQIKWQEELPFVSDEIQGVDLTFA
jgi:hypothetical protein